VTKHCGSVQSGLSPDLREERCALNGPCTPTVANRRISRGVFRTRVRARKFGASGAEKDPLTRDNRSKQTNAQLRAHAFHRARARARFGCGSAALYSLYSFYISSPWTMSAVFEPREIRSPSLSSIGVFAETSLPLTMVPFVDSRSTRKA
jgi:hypothetical protein